MFATGVSLFLDETAMMHDAPSAEIIGSRSEVCTLAKLMPLDGAFMGLLRCALMVATATFYC